MNIIFNKYQGTGNDFIMIDDRDDSFDISQNQLIREMCNRRFGIGADGLILLRNEQGYDFKMVYFNSDGNESTMCGNGGRCIVKFAHSLGVFDENCTFLAVDGPHEAKVLEDGSIKLKMGDVNAITQDQTAYVLDTGSPHYVLKVDSISELDIKQSGSQIRYSEKYLEKGINVNFIEFVAGRIKVATYERGVEDETFSCGTGVTASAIVANEIGTVNYLSPIKIQTKGGDLLVYFTKESDGSYTHIWLQGGALKTFEGVWR